MFAVLVLSIVGHWFRKESLLHHYETIGDQSLELATIGL
jgi:hypothetical protein